MTNAFIILDEKEVVGVFLCPFLAVHRAFDHVLDLDDLSKDIGEWGIAMCLRQQTTEEVTIGKTVEGTTIKIIVRHVTVAQ